jgi:ribosome-binding ATPase YchF (GTP1/OBG family)
LSSQRNVADVQVPDERVEYLTDLFKPKKKALSAVLFKDIQVDFTSQGGLGAATLAELRSCDAVTLIVRAFENDAVVHPLNTVDPLRDFHHLLDALLLSDFAVAEKRIGRLAKEGKRGEWEYQRLEKILERLGQGRLLGKGFLSPEDQRQFAGFAFLTAKPIIVVANTGEGSADTRALGEVVMQKGLFLFHIQGQAEMEIAQLEPQEQVEFLEHLGIEEPVKDRFLRTIYSQLNLISFLTAGEDEVRAWRERSIRSKTEMS